MFFDGYMAAPPTITVFSCANVLNEISAETNTAANFFIGFLLRNAAPFEC
jgi:hypothetical protein